MQKEFYFPILSIIAIIFGELAIFHKDVLYGLSIHIINLLAIIIIIILNEKMSIKINNALQSLVLVILLRVMNLSIPLFFTTILQQYPLIYGIMFLPIYILIQNQHISTKELGINFRRFYIYLPISILIGVIMTAAEYRILDPLPLRQTRLSDMVLIVIISIIFIGSVEEIIFRIILQSRLEKIFGLRYGILSSGLLFGIMHSTYGVINEILLASIFGIALGYIFKKTKSLPFIVSINGITNISSFGILPFFAISNPVYSPDIISTGGEFVAIFLIIVFLMSFILLDTKYLSRYTPIIKIFSNSMICILMAIVIYKIMLAI
jgi:membrane protease YdiL (CAAX protease family)